MALNARSKAFSYGVVHLARYGYTLNMRSLAVLFAVYGRTEELYTVRELAELLRMERPGITRVIDTLERAGLRLVKRISDPNDARSVLIDCTEEGYDFMEKMYRVVSGETGVEENF